MKYILLLTIMLTLVFVSSAARVEKRNIYISEARAMADDVPGAVIDGYRASAKEGYLFAQESRNSISVLKVARGSARLQTGTLVCVSPDNAACDVYLAGNRTQATCKGQSNRCHFIGVRGGVRAP
jgi:hypothetical protein